MAELRFAVPGEQHAALILGWRTQPRITRMMFSDVSHGVDEQRQWLRAAVLRPDYRHWLALDGDRPIGLANLQDIDWERRESASGFYVGEEDANPLAGFILAHLYNHAFHRLGFVAMTAQVMAENTDVLRLHRAHGYVDDGMVEGGVVKNGIRHDVHRLRLTREAWMAKRAYQRYRAEFPWP